MKFIKELFLLFIEILVLLKSNFILPFNLFRFTIKMVNALLNFLHLSHDSIMLYFLLLKSNDFSISLCQWFDNLVVGFLLVHFLSLHISILSSLSLKIIFQLFNDIQICISNIRIILFDITIFFLVFLCNSLDFVIFLFLNCFDFSSSLSIHFISEHDHFILVFHIYLSTDSFKLLSSFSLFFHLFISQSIQIFSMSDFMLFLTYFNSSKILFELSLVDSIFVFDVFKSNLCFFL